MYKVYFNIENVTQLLEKGEFTLFPKPYKIVKIIRLSPSYKLFKYSKTFGNQAGNVPVVTGTSIS